MSQCTYHFLKKIARNNKGKENETVKDRDGISVTRKAFPNSSPYSFTVEAVEAMKDNSRS